MREVTTTTTLYTYEELSDDAKGTVRQWLNVAAWEDGRAQEDMAAIFDDVMHVRGWREPFLRTYDLYRQGGFPVFSGDLPGWVHDGRTYTVTVSASHVGMGDEFMRTEVYEEDTTNVPLETPGEAVAREARARDAAREMVHNLSAELFYKFRDADEYLGSDEYAAEVCEGNGYEFTVDGKLAVNN